MKHGKKLGEPKEFHNLLSYTNYTIIVETNPGSFLLQPKNESLNNTFIK